MNEQSKMNLSIPASNAVRPSTERTGMPSLRLIWSGGSSPHREDVAMSLKYKCSFSLPLAPGNRSTCSSDGFGVSANVEERANKGIQSHLLSMVLGKFVIDECGMIVLVSTIYSRLIDSCYVETMIFTDIV
jgi:hypothetical protein